MEKESRTLFWWFQIIGWIVFTGLFLPIFSSNYFESVESRLKISITIVLGFILSCILRLIYKRFPKHTLSPASLTFLMLALSTAGSIIWVIIDYSISAAVWGRKKDFIDPFEAIQTLSTDATILFGWSLLYFSLKLLLDWNFEKKRAESALDMARDASLQSLRYQLDSHFLFNVLNTINVLIDNNSDSAKKVVSELSDFLRYSLSNHNIIYLSLRQELDAMEHYFEIQRIRFEEKLQVKINVSDEAKTALILSFLLHPIIENAVKYGMRTSPSPLIIDLSASTGIDTLNIKVSNTGHWVETDDNLQRQIDGTGTGLENVQKRLKKAYAKKHEFLIIKNEDSVVVDITIPFQRDAR